MSFAIASFVFGFAVVSGGMLAYSVSRLVGAVVDAGLDKLFEKWSRDD